MEHNATLPLVKGKEDILRNIETLDLYLSKSNSKQCEYAKNLIRKGHCFAIIHTEDGYRFYPSRFIGYIGNSMEAHEKMGEIRRSTGITTRDGKKTTPAITKLLGQLIKEGYPDWDKWEAEYKKFCDKLDIVPDKNQRKYWPPIIK